MSDRKSFELLLFAASWSSEELVRKLELFLEKKSVGVMCRYCQIFWHIVTAPWLIMIPSRRAVYRAK
jgi:hypothetical protein